MTTTIPLTLTLTLTDADSNAEPDVELLEELTQEFYDQLPELADQIQRVPATDPATGLQAKGDKKEPGILQMEVNLENIQKLSKWLWERLIGKTVKVGLVYDKDKGRVEYTIDGGRQQDLATVMRDMEAFVEKIASQPKP